MYDNFTAKDFGAAITKLVNKQNFSRNEMAFIFKRVLRDEETDMQQGALLAALAAKGETTEEIAAVWDSIYEIDTVKVTPNIKDELMENSGTGMDTIKTFNISTAAAVAAASGGIYMARHGARAITSQYGTVDMAEALGIDVEAEPQVAQKSIEQCGIGLFNGTSPSVHPVALGRILSQISFGSILNIAASLANPASPTLGVRGVYTPDMVKPVAEIMREIGYRRCMVVHGHQNDGSPGIDEASTMGKTSYAELKEDGTIEEGSFYPEDFLLKRAKAEDLVSSCDKEKEAMRLAALFKGKREGKDLDIVCLNTALILYIGKKARSLPQGLDMAKDIFATAKPWRKLNEWAENQTMNKIKSQNRLKYLAESVG